MTHVLRNRFRDMYFVIKYLAVMDSGTRKRMGIVQQMLSITEFSEGQLKTQGLGKRLPTIRVTTPLYLRQD